MKLRLDERQLQALVNLRTNPDFQDFTRAIADHGEVLIRKLIYATSDVQVLQGQSQQITEILEAIAEAPQKLATARQPKQ